MSVQKQMKMAHSTSVVVSLIVNGALLIALLFFITLGGDAPPPTSQVKVIKPAEKVEIEEIEEEIIPEETVQDVDMTDFSDFDMSTDIDTDFDTQPTEVTTDTTSNVNELANLMSDIASPVTMTGLMSGRNAAARAGALRKYGAGVGGISEPAVMRALRWLRDHQMPNGAWDKDGRTDSRAKANAGYTGLALLAFLAHGETPSSQEFGETVSKGLRYLVENQDSSGMFQPAGGHKVYGHAMATYAVSEAYTMTQNILLKEPMDSGVKVIIDGMQPNGGFDYNYAMTSKKMNGARSDTSVSAWQVQALKAAKIAGTGDQRILSATQKAVDNMLSLSADTEYGTGIAYSNGKKRNAHKTISMATSLVLHLTGRGKTRESKDIYRFVEHWTQGENEPEWGKQVIGGYGGEIYAQYYAVQALFHDNPGGRQFKSFFRGMVQGMVKNQAPDGRWDDFTGNGKDKGPVMNTSLGALGLMVAYRYLPTGQAENFSRPEETLPVEDDDVAEFEIL